jgi:hypothetical protein
MEYAKKGGEGWRRELEGWMRLELRHEVFNPNVESAKFLRRRIPGKNIRALKTSDSEGYMRILRDVVKLDSREIAYRSDYVVCYWDVSARRGAGTKGEVTIARFFQKPVYIVTRVPLQHVPGWVLGCATKIFRTFTQLKRFLLEQYPPTS